MSLPRPSLRQLLHQPVGLFKVELQVGGQLKQLPIFHLKPLILNPYILGMSPPLHKFRHMLKDPIRCFTHIPLNLRTGYFYTLINGAAFSGNLTHLTATLLHSLEIVSDFGNSLLVLVGYLRLLGPSPHNFEFQ